MGFKALQRDQYLFTHKASGAILLLYMDDLLIFARDYEVLQDIKNKLNAEFKMKDMAEASYYLGIRIL
jgi:hypothetical protein